MITAKEAYGISNYTDTDNELEKISDKIKEAAENKNTNVSINLDIPYDSLKSIRDELIKFDYEVTLHGKEVYVYLVPKTDYSSILTDKTTPIVGYQRSEHKIVDYNGAGGIVRHVDYDYPRVLVEMFLGSKDFTPNTCIKTDIGKMYKFNILSDKPHGMNISWGDKEKL